jgi:Tol biopolymer transport system component/DNA-binding winged helix-turn-helix (wHTH) protein
VEPESNHRVRFKTFELDLNIRELRRNGRRLKLQGQPLEVLAILLERPGKVVTREQLRRKLWPEDTFVDFEHGLNSTIRRLREALGDRAENPRFIETLPRLGYRFIAPLDPQEDHSAEPVFTTNGSNGNTEIPTLNGDAAEFQPVQHFSSTELVAPNPPRRGHQWRPWSASAAGVILLFALSALWYAHQPLPAPHITEIVQLTSDVRFHRKVALGTDGARVYLSLEPPALGSVPVTGGDISVTPIVVPGAKPVYAECQSDVSPDGLSFLACGAHKNGMSEVWVVGTSGFPARYLVDAYDISWSRDGKQVVYATAHGDIYAMPSGGGASRLVLPSNGILPRCPIWSPDGGRIRFVRDSRIWEISSNGGDVREILSEMHDSVRKYCGRWTPDGAFYIFLSAKSLRSGLQIWALDERRSWLHSPRKDPVQLTSGPNSWYLPVISPDSRTLYAPNENRQGELVRFDTTTRQFHPHLDGISAEEVDFSPNGSYAAYVSYPDSTLWRVNSDGSGRIQLATPPPEANARGLHWSPDGRHIAFAEIVAGKQSAGKEAIYMIPAAGGTPVRFLPEVKESQSGPTWSPDGKRLAYWVNNGDETSTSDIRIVDVASRHITHLPPAPKNAMWPEWSPNGQYIVCETDWWNATEFGIEIFDTTTAQWKIVSQPSPPIHLHWSRDSRFVYFLRPQDQDAEPGVYRMDILDGRIERVVDLKEFLTTGTRRKTWFGLDQGGAPLLLRDVGTFEVFALTLDRH